MLRKIFVCALTLTAVICLVGCGEEKIDGTPDKAVLAYAEIAMTGDSENMSAAGFTENDRKEIRYNMARTFIDALSGVAPLSQSSAEKITQIYFDRLKGEVKIQTTLKKNDPDRPIVTITTTPIDQGSSARSAAAKNEELIALIGMVGKLKSEGANEDALKENADVQNLAITALTKYINNIQFQDEKTIDVLCNKVTGSDGKVHWAPVDSAAFVDFLTGKK